MDGFHGINNELDSNHVSLVDSVEGIRDFYKLMITSAATFTHVAGHCWDYDDEALALKRYGPPIMLYFDSAPAQGLVGGDNVMVISAQMGAWKGHAKGNPFTLLPLSIGLGSDSDINNEQLVRLELKRLEKYRTREPIQVIDSYGRQHLIDVSRTRIIVKYIIHGRSMYGRCMRCYLFLCDIHSHKRMVKEQISCSMHKLIQVVIRYFQ